MSAVHALTQLNKSRDRLVTKIGDVHDEYAAKITNLELNLKAIDSAIAALTESKAA